MQQHTSVLFSGGHLLLVGADCSELLLLQHLHQRLLQRLPHNNLQYGLHLKVKVEQVTLHLRLLVHPVLLRYKQRACRPVQHVVRLRRQRLLQRSVADLLQVRLRLNVHVAPPVHCIGCAGGGFLLVCAPLQIERRGGGGT